MKDTYMGGNITVFHTAVVYSSQISIGFLIKNCPDLLQEVNGDNNTVLAYAAHKADPTIMKMLIDACPDIVSIRGQL